MKKILFLIHDLGGGGAEKVLVNLVNNMNHEMFDITVMALFGGGVNEKRLSPNVKLINCHNKNIRGNSYLMKLFTPKRLYHYYIKDHYDIVISYLEGPCSRIVSGCEDPTTKTVSWIHSTMKTKKEFIRGFRSYCEAINCYNRIDSIVFVSESVQRAFNFVAANVSKQCVVYNTNESERIRKLAREEVHGAIGVDRRINWCGVGKLTKNKGFDRLIRIQKKLKDSGIPSHLYILGEGEEKQNLQKQIGEADLSDSVTLLGYQLNPYKYLARCDLYVCASHSEGFSTAATEALIVGTPVCTVDVSGMKELLGRNNEWGIVTQNDDELLYLAIRDFMTDIDCMNKYKLLAKERGDSFSTERTVQAAESVLINL